MRFSLILHFFIWSFRVICLRWKVYDEKSKMYLVLELVSGGELFDRIVARGHYTEMDAVSLMGQVLNALGYLHSIGIVHRDLKPENLLYATNVEDSPHYNTIKLADFGLAKVLNGTADHSMTTTCGTPGYVAPEILTQRHAYGKEVDLWSLGVILYILLCGFPPFYDENNAALYNQIKRGDYTFPSPYWDGISRPAIEVIKRLLTVDPTKRATVDEVLAHPWMKCQDGQSSVNLAGAQEQLKKFNARRKFKNAVNTVMAVGRMAHFFDGPKEGKAADAAPAAR
mmetsp:Transcript_9503/g.27289  ORF Transcript_9503/g.27289 Transcript_9503/m.27289 type:complete len:283 (-) Transcript_9503:94-942(-)